MSRAFVKEQDGSEAYEELPDRPLSANPNYVTARGLRLMDEELASLRQALAQAQGARDRAAIARHARDLRYWQARRASAQLIPPRTSEKVGFSSTVTIEREDGRRQSLSIVGEDEADAGKGLIAYTAPIARTLLGRTAGEEVELAAGTAEILSIEPYTAA